MLDTAGITEDHVTLVGVDYSKKAIGNLAEAFNIQRVPTFIVLKDGKEVGRVVEYGTSGQWDKELSEIVAGKKVSGVELLTSVYMKFHLRRRYTCRGNAHHLPARPT